MSLVNGPTLSLRRSVASAASEPVHLNDRLHRVGPDDTFEITHQAAAHLGAVGDSARILRADTHSVDQATTTSAVIGGVRQALHDVHQAVGAALAAVDVDHAAFEKASALDANHDGKLSGHELDGLRAWVDDGNGAIDDGELKTLVDMSHAGLNLKMQLTTDPQGELMLRSTFFKDGVQHFSEQPVLAEGGLVANGAALRTGEQPGAAAPNGGGPVAGLQNPGQPNAGLQNGGPAGAPGQPGAAQPPAGGVAPPNGAAAFLNPGAPQAANLPAGGAVIAPLPGNGPVIDAMNRVFGIWNTLIQRVPQLAPIFQMQRAIFAAAFAPLANLPGAGAPPQLPNFPGRPQLPFLPGGAGNPPQAANPPGALPQAANLPGGFPVANLPGVPGRQALRAAFQQVGGLLNQVAALHDESQARVEQRMDEARTRLRMMTEHARA